MNFVSTLLAVVILLLDAASAQLVMVPCLAVRPPAAVVAHVGGDEVVGARKVFTYSKNTLKEHACTCIKFQYKSCLQLFVKPLLRLNFGLQCRTTFFEDSQILFY